MITDKEANKVYFSGLISSKEERMSSFSDFMRVLEKHQIRHKLLSDTKDIWCRDYMPIQVKQNKFIQFRYQPSYLKDCLNLQSDPTLVLASNGITAEFSRINLDGGNVIKWNDKAILTERVFKENHDVSRNKLIKDIENLLEAQVLIIPDIINDMTGHADGHLRFIDGKTVLVNELKNERDYWQKGFMKMIKESGLTFVEIPWFEDKDKKNPDSALGIYVNYLEISDLILFPIFGIEGNKDQQAIDVIRSVFPDRIIETININSIAKEGGLLNCVTWTIKE